MDPSESSTANSLRRPSDEGGSLATVDLPQQRAKSGGPCRAGFCALLIHPLCSGVEFIRRLNRTFGWRFTVMLFAAYFGIKGLLYTVGGVVQLPYYQSYLNVSGTDYQMYGSIAVTPFAMKGITGTVSDAVPFFGYHKASYVIAAAIVGTVSFLALAALDLSAPASACFFFLVSVETSVVDLLCEGKYAELMRERPESGSDLVTWVWATYHGGSLLASCMTGPIADNLSVKIIFWVCIPFAAAIIVPTAAGFMQDRRLPRGQRAVKWGKIRRHGAVLSLAVLMAVCALAQALLNLVFRNSPTVPLVFALVVSAVLCAAAFRCLPRRLALCNLFLFLDSALYIQIGGALDYWYTAREACVPGGPAFDYTYFTTYARIVGSIAAWVGVCLFQECPYPWRAAVPVGCGSLTQNVRQSVMSTWRIRNIFLVSTLLRCAAGIFDVGIVERWNIAAGIPDKTMYILGDAIVYEVCYMLAFMPSVVLTSKLCPKELESTLFALLAGFQNFGQQVARAAGVSLIGVFGLRTELPCVWDGLPWLVATCHILTPLLLIPLTFILIPDVRMTDDILGDGAASGREREDQVHKLGDKGGDVELSPFSLSTTLSDSAPVSDSDKRALMGGESSERSE